MSLANSRSLYQEEASTRLPSGSTMSMYDLEEDRLLAEITGRGARRLLIQLPDGLKNEGPRLASLVRERTGADVFVSASSAWGACDLSLDAAARVVVLQIGRAHV